MDLLSSFCDGRSGKTEILAVSSARSSVWSSETSRRVECGRRRSSVLYPYRMPVASSVEEGSFGLGNHAFMSPVSSASMLKKSYGADFEMMR